MIPVGAAPGQLAFDFSLDDVSGQRIKLSDLRGHPVVVNFWATWCPPCRQELPALQSAYQRFRDQGVILFGVDVQRERRDHPKLYAAVRPDVSTVARP